MFVKLYVGGLKLFVHIATNVVDVLCLGKRLAGLSLFVAEVSCWWLGDSVERDFDVVAVSVLIKFDVTHFLVRNDCGVVGGHVAGKFGEVGCHSFWFVIAGGSVDVVFSCVVGDCLQVEKVKEYFITN